MSTAPFRKELAETPRPNDKQKIVEHYDFVSPYYQTLWGEHIHHGYWIRGNETKEEAQTQLIEHLAELASLQTGASVLDIGCGFGGTSLYLAQKYQARATGITISPVQVEMAKKAARRGAVGHTVSFDGRRSAGFSGAVRRAVVGGVHLPLSRSSRILYECGAIPETRWHICVDGLV